MAARTLNPRCLLTALLLALMCSSCGSKYDESINYGRLEGQVYHNDYFGLRVTLPGDWIYKDHRTETRPVRIPDGRVINQKVPPTELSVLNLLVLNHPPTGSHTYEPSFIVAAHKLNDTFGITDGRAFLERTNAEIAFSLDSIPGVTQTASDITTQELGGRTFHSITISYTKPEQSFQQLQLCRIERGYALLFILTYTAAAEYDMGQNILRSVRFR